ncbi:hypothetical protein ENUP19_0047G0026 [Entamoeba nuttalli]|uniref:Ubiquitin carboxyl-terminal hydrolase domain containing protein n=2 Tax=Entamoeba nuttalli TaxID=412467 RepID=K2GIS9_ENTNP|nr:ubiquitin carboxyl-terminal hydrolase domain containing protein [Entamoeba nuttalli P19]EKE42611.1 ubiquitin carboxyl-terminal hydrolase domain containing protein [Entamoeba nuttalli P19]|eukprot:XP_008855046.1 ubiquitin carboxyl-terminal hydrolase domain containing protein [Entamoeba nuttalli P19]
MSDSIEKIKKEEENIDDFSHRIIDINKGINSNRVDLQIKALIAINNEFEEYENSGMKRSFISLFRSTKPEKKGSNQNIKTNHKVATKNELLSFLKFHSQDILNLIIKCPHEELLRHSIPVIEHINSNKLLSPHFIKSMCDNAERIGGTILLRAQDIVISVFNSMSSIEKNHIIHSTLENSQKGNLPALHMLCKLIQIQALPSQQIVTSFSLIVKHIQELNEDIIKICSINSYIIPLKRIIIGAFKDKTNDPRMSIVLTVLASTSPFGGDADEINKMIEEAFVKEVPNLGEPIKLIGKSDDSVFKICLMCIIDSDGFTGAMKWIRGEWNNKRAEFALNILEERKELPSSASSFVKEVFIQYNVLVTRSIIYDFEQRIITSIKFEGVYGLNLLWKMLMITGEWSIEQLLEVLYQKMQLRFVQDGIEAFKSNPTAQGANCIESVLKRYSSPKTIIKDDVKQTRSCNIRWISLKRTIREDKPCSIPSIQMKMLASLKVMSSLTKVTKVLIESAQQDIERTFHFMDKSDKLNLRKYEHTTPISKIVLDSIKDLLNDPYAQDSMKQSINWLMNKKYSVNVFINGTEVPIFKNIGSYLSEMGEIVIQISSGDSEIQYQEPIKKEPSFITNTTRTVVVKEEKNIERCSEQSIKELIELLEDEKTRNNAMKVICGVNKYVKWEENAIELATKEGPKQLLGIARLESIEEGLKDEEYKKLLTLFTELVIKQSGIKEILSSILIKNEIKVNTNVFIMNEETLNQLSKEIENDLDKSSMTLCLVLLLKNGRNIPWDKDVFTAPILRALKDGINKQIFDSVVPLLNEPPKLVEECNRIIIEYADENCENDHPFIQSLIQNLTKFGYGLNVAVRAFKTMKKKQVLLIPYFCDIIDKLFPMQGKNILKDDEINNLIILLCECVESMNDITCSHCFNHFNQILKEMNGCNEKATYRKGQFGGLVNQGSTCYMNSVLQQIFHSSRCTANLLKKEVKIPTLIENTDNQKNKPKEEQEKKEITVDVNNQVNDTEKDINKEGQFITYNQNEFKDYRMIFGLQKLFVDMLKGINSATQTKEFCKEAHGSCYENIKTYEQMDAQEFFTTAMSSMENCKHYESIVSGSKVFTGEMEISIGSQCGHEVKRTEQFYCSALEVEHYQTIEQSLQALCEGSILCDYRCEQCGKQNDAQRSERYKELPETLVFHLKRFVYNDQFEIVKYNGKFEYPNELDMKKYCCDGYNGETMYKLVGVVIHNGDAHGGHYFSNRLINGKWVCFNDRSVNAAEGETWFGGKSSSAYILFYEQASMIEQTQKEMLEIVIDQPLKQYVERKNNIAYISQRATNPFLVDLICSFIKTYKHFGNIFDFISSVTAIVSPSSLNKIFSTIDLILDVSLAQEFLEKITPLLKMFIVEASSIIIKSIKLVQCESFNEEILKLVKKGENGTMKILKILCDLNHFQIKDVIEVTKEFIKNYNYNRSEGYYAFCILLKGIDLNLFTFEEDFIMKLIGSKAPDNSIESLIKACPFDLINKIVVTICTDALKRGFINNEEILFIKRMTVSEVIAETIALESKSQILLCNSIESAIKTITVALKLTSCSPMIYNQLKQQSTEINNNIIDFSIKIDI